jgi:hypothetical protein
MQAMLVVGSNGRIIKTVQNFAKNTTEFLVSLVKI